jgi:S1/P1 Nuclease
MKPSHLAVLALALTGFSSEALAWGADGHRAVAAIALKLLPPDKAQAAENLLRNSDVGRGFVDAASYADEVIRERDHRHVFSPWHFVIGPWTQRRIPTAFATLIALPMNYPSRSR